MRSVKDEAATRRFRGKRTSGSKDWRPRNPEFVGLMTPRLERLLWCRRYRIYRIYRIYIATVVLTGCLGIAEKYDKLLEVVCISTEHHRYYYSQSRPFRLPSLILFRFNLSSLLLNISSRLSSFTCFSCSSEGSTGTDLIADSKMRVWSCRPA